MTKEQYLLTTLAEECSEVAFAASKAIRFGLNSKNPKDGRGNIDAIMQEFYDIVAMVEMLQKDKVLPIWSGYQIEKQTRSKVEKVENQLENLNISCK